MPGQPGQGQGGLPGTPSPTRSERFPLSDLLGGGTLKKRTGEVVDMKSALRQRAVLLYFAEKSEQCKSFTVLFVKFFDMVWEIDHSITVVIVPMDKTQEAAVECFRMPSMHDQWLMVAWSVLLPQIAAAFAVEKTPSLMVVGQDGEVLVRNAKEQIIELVMDDRGNVLDLDNIKVAVAAKWGCWRDLIGVQAVTPEADMVRHRSKPDEEEAERSMLDMFREMMCSCHGPRSEASKEASASFRLAGAAAPEPPRKPVPMAALRNKDAASAPKGNAREGLQRKAKEDKHPKVAGPGALRAKGAGPEPESGYTDKWSFDEREGYNILVTTTNTIEPEEVASKEVAIEMVRRSPHKYFGCEWVNPPFEGPAKVFRRDCDFFQSGFEANTDQPEAFGAMRAEYRALPADALVKPDAHTDEGCLSSFQNRRLSPKSPGRQQGLLDAPGLKMIGDVNPNDIDQGAIGDCWLLSAISALAEFEGVIHLLLQPNGNLDVLPRDEFNTYVVKLYDLREWKPVEVLVDERLLWDDERKELVGCKPSADGQIWPCILEKAVAAHCGGWHKICGGQSTHAWRILLGCREVYLMMRADDGNFGCFGAYNPNSDSWEQLENSPLDGFQSLWPMKWPEVGGGGDLQQTFDEVALFEKMCHWDDANYVMCAGTKQGSDENTTDGIVDGHAYTVIECIDNAGGTAFDMVKLRNPWGKQEFESGGWEDDGPNWKAYPQVYEACGRPKPADDGIFWMDRQTFFRYFETIYLCAMDMSAFEGH